MRVYTFYIHNIRENKMPGGLLLISFERKKFLYTSFVAFNIQNVCTILCRKQIFNDMPY